LPIFLHEVAHAKHDLPYLRDKNLPRNLPTLNYQDQIVKDDFWDERERIADEWARRRIGWAEYHAKNGGGFGDLLVTLLQYPKYPPGGIYPNG